MILDRVYREDVWGQKIRFFARTKVFGKYFQNLVRCTKCGAIFFEYADWLEESYSQPIAEADLGLLSRNIGLAEGTEKMILAFFDRHGTFRDFGGGYGIFVRLMRDKGFNYYYEDKYCENLFSKDFHVNNAPASTFELTTAFEVLEHLVEPLTTLDTIMANSSNLLFTTEILPEPPPPPDKWWYYCLWHGQHVTFYTVRALETMAARYKRHFFTDGSSLHAFTRKPIFRERFNLLFKSRLSGIATWWLRRKRSLPSLLQRDFEQLTGMKLNSKF